MSSAGRAAQVTISIMEMAHFQDVEGLSKNRTFFFNSFQRTVQTYFAYE